jgi:hypothetical protein
MPGELTVAELLELYASYYPHPRPVDETIELVGLEEDRDSRAMRLSGGQQRRLDVGLALIGDPELVFLDEPTTGFDPAARHHAWEVISNLRDLGKTVFLTTHYMEEAQALADRLAVIVAGRIVSEGTPETLGGRDKAPSEVSFTMPPGIDATTLPPELAVRAERRDGRFHLRSEHPAWALHKLGGWALDQGCELADLTVGRPLRRRATSRVWRLSCDWRSPSCDICCAMLPGFLPGISPGFWHIELSVWRSCSTASLSAALPLRPDSSPRARLPVRRVAASWLTESTRSCMDSRSVTAGAARSSTISMGAVASRRGFGPSSRSGTSIG